MTAWFHRFVSVFIYLFIFWGEGRGDLFRENKTLAKMSEFTVTLDKKLLVLDLREMVTQKVCVSTYTLPHNLFKEKLTELIEHTFNREGSL